MIYPTLRNDLINYIQSTFFLEDRKKKKNTRSHINLFFLSGRNFHEYPLFIRSEMMTTSGPRIVFILGKYQFLFFPVAIFDGVEEQVEASASNSLVNLAAAILLGLKAIEPKPFASLHRDIVQRTISTGRLNAAQSYKAVKDSSHRLYFIIQKQLSFFYIYITGGLIQSDFQKSKTGHFKIAISFYYYFFQRRFSLEIVFFFTLKSVFYCVFSFFIVRTVWQFSE